MNMFMLDLLISQLWLMLFFTSDVIEVRFISFVIAIAWLIASIITLVVS